ncbi:unnamed protein product [Prorocentrum cordatum]|uniref:Aminotransferase class I/classII large domain-containing protein n=1 Tax=Prorocentrum cordatum TaxID=2364126 RepID=A0ABN9WCL4_9DINO|nr:unnamed protein product [Polarella glacialis]
MPGAEADPPACPPPRPPLSKRAALASLEPLSYQADFFSILGNLWHPQSNPGGVVNLGVAENKFCRRLLQDRVARCHLSVPDDLVGYSDFAGCAELRRAFAGVLERLVFRNGAAVDPDRLVLSNGCTSTLTMLAQILSDGELPRGTQDSGCRAGKKILYVAPRYPAFRSDLRGLADVETVQVLPSKLGALPTAAELDAVWAREASAPAAGRDADGGAECNSIVAMIVCNPDNPTGVSYTEAELMEVVSWCRKRSMYLIADEIYGAGCWGQGERRFTSLVGHADVTIWGLSKDFASSGARVSVACVPTRGGGDSAAADGLLEALKGRSILHALPNVAQVVLLQLLTDDEFMDSYLSACREAMFRAAEEVKAFLRRLGIPFVDSQGGMFLWADFSACGLSSHELFSRLLRGHGVFLTPGAEFFDKHGPSGVAPESVRWMRLCFGACDGPDALREGLRRVEAFVAESRAAASTE